MNFKKLALVAAALALSTSFAAAATAADPSADGVANTAEALYATALTEFAAQGTVNGDGAGAFIVQETSTNVALIDQTGKENFGAIIQTNTSSNIGSIYQIGDTNRAMIYQH
jgi:hypothetical protein